MCLSFYWTAIPCRVIPLNTLEGFPVPVKDADSGLSAALSVTVTEADKEPKATGRKVTVMLQLAPCGKAPPQVVDSKKSMVFAPVRAIEEMLNAAPPLLDKV